MSTSASVSSANPLLNITDLPPFGAFNPADIQPAMQELLAHNKQLVTQLTANLDATNLDNLSWGNFITPLEAAEDKLSRAWSPVSHLNGVQNNPELRAAYQACLPLLTEYATWFKQHPGVYKAYKHLAAAQEAAQQESFSPAQKAKLDIALRDLRLGGSELAPEQQQRFAQIQQRLAELSNQFSNNLLDATQGWHKLVTKSEDLAGLPASAQQAAAAAAQAKDLEGWLFTLDFPSFQPVMAYAANRQLRQEVYSAFVTRASDKAALAGHAEVEARDNSQLMVELVSLKQEQAKLLGFPSYAHLSLERKMASSPTEVLEFLQQLAQQAYPQAQQEFAELETFAKEQGLDQLEPWDVAYYSEQLRLARYNLSQEELRPWFPAPKVIQGLLQIAGQLFDLEFQPDSKVRSWHPDVQYFRVLRSGQELAGFYLDLYAREGKRGGAWMDVCRDRRRTATGQLQLPVAYLTCNFTPPLANQPSLLTHNEVTTLFHEFGHGLHHMLTQVEVPDVAGINGVAWDAVELPSQFMENFCWEKQGLDLIAGHFETGAPLPEELFKQMLAAKNFQAAMQMVRQLEFALFDFRLHLELQQPSVAAIQQLLDAVRAEVSVVPVAEFNRFQQGFAHIFAGGYAAGYYSYKWAEVLSADAFAAFEEEGILNPATGQRFRRYLLEQGASQSALDLFVGFRGREPQIDALLRHSGIH